MKQFRHVVVLWGSGKIMNLLKFRVARFFGAAGMTLLMAGQAYGVAEELYRHGLGAYPTNAVVAYRLFVRAVGEGSVEAIMAAGHCCEYGRGAVTNKSLAYMWRAQAMNLDVLAACRGLAEIDSLYHGVREGDLTERCERFAANNSDRDVAHDYVIQLLKEGKQSEAEDMLERTIIKFGPDAQLLFERAVMARSRWAKQDAEIYFRGVQALSEKGPYVRAAQAAVKMDNDAEVTEGFAVLQSLMDENPNDPFFTWLFAIQCREQKKNHQAGAKAYEKILAIWKPGPVMVHHTYANILTESLKQPDAALPFRERALSLAQRGWTYQGYANTLRELGRYAEACDAFEKAVEINPSSKRYLRQWSSCLLALGKAYGNGIGEKRNHARARDCYLKSYDMGNNNVVSHLAELYARGGYGIDRDLEQAEFWLRKLAEKQPMRQGEESSILRVGTLVAVRRLTPRKQPVFVNYYQTCTYLKQEANRGIQSAIDLLAWLYAVNEHASSKNRADAVQMAQQLCQERDNPQWRNTLAAAYARNGEYEKAIIEQQRAIALLTPERIASDEGSAFEERLELYRNGQAYSAYVGSMDLISAAPQPKQGAIPVDDVGVRMLRRGHVFEKGRDGEEINYALAMEWYRKAVVEGRSEAQVNMGTLFAKGGYGIERDLDKAEEILGHFIARRVKESGRAADYYRFGNLSLGKVESGTNLSFKIDYAKTIANYRESAEQGGESEKEFLAWIYAACPDPQYRNGPEAVRLANEICHRDEGNPHWKNTLAAACARTDDFLKAAAVQEEALSLLSPDCREGSEGKGYAERLELYRQGEAFPPD